MKQKRNRLTVGPMSKPFFRVNMRCETNFENCPLKPFNCLSSRGGDLEQKIMGDHSNMACMPSQLSQQVGSCNQQNSTKKHKICDGAFQWCNGEASVTSVLQKVPWLDNECSQKIAEECELRYRCFQQCLQKQQSGECVFFAINTKNYRNFSGRLSAQNCQTFATLFGAEQPFSPASCGPWKVYQMSCAHGPCDDLDAVASTETSTMKAEYSTTVSGLCVVQLSILAHFHQEYI